MSYDKDKTFQPQSLIIHSPDYVENLQRQLAVINFDVAYSNFFPQCELAIKMIHQVEDAIEQGIIDLSTRPDLKLDEQSVYKLKRLWDGDCYITIVDHDTSTELFHYDKETIDYNNPDIEVIPIPALDNMTPIGQVKQKTLLIEISQSMPLKYAWQGMNWAVLVEEGNLRINAKEGLVPLITREDLSSTTKYTLKISRDVYHKIIKKLKNLFIKYWSKIYNDMHQIVEYLIKNTDNEKPTHEFKSLVRDDKKDIEEDDEDW